MIVFPKNDTLASNSFSSTWISGYLSFLILGDSVKEGTFFAKRHFKESHYLIKRLFYPNKICQELPQRSMPIG